MTIRYEHFRTIDLDSIVFLIAGRVIAKVHGQCNVEIFAEFLVDVHFEGIRLGGGLLDVHEAIDECLELVEPIEIGELVGIDIHGTGNILN